MLDLNDLASFARVVDHRGFSAAARVLGVSKSTLSQRIARLETALGARLLQRTSRRFVVTDAGRDLHRHASAMLVEADAAESTVRGLLAEPRGVVRLTSSVGMAQRLSTILPRFLALHPDVRVVHHATNRFVDLVAEGFDLGLRGHEAPLPDSDLVQRPLARTPWHLFASPAYLEAAGEPSSPEELPSHACLVVPNRLGETAWRLRRVGAPDVRVELSPRLASDDLETIRTAAFAGLGIAAMPAYWAAEASVARRLRRVLPEWVTGNAQVTLVMATRRGQLPAVRALVDFLVAEYPPLLLDRRSAPRRRKRRP